MKDNLTATVIKEKHPRRPPIAWRALDWQTGLEIDRNNCLPILRAKYGQSAKYRSIR